MRFVAGSIESVVSDLAFWGLPSTFIVASGVGPPIGKTGSTGNCLLIGSTGSIIIF